MLKVLVVEDDKKISEALAHILEENDYQVDCVYDGMDGLYYATNQDYDIIILDVMMPKMNGYDVIKMLRKKNIATPTIMLTAKNEIDDRVIGLDSGADDYMVKPFAPKELLARMRAMSRRVGEVVMDEISFCDVTININTYTMMCNGKSVNLSNKEFQLLSLLIKNVKTILSKEQLITKVWGDDSEASDNNVEAYISFIRKKLLYVGSCVNIKSIRMVGYMLEEGGND
jgi:DNA-binding response OmpR family regulator